MWHESELHDMSDEFVHSIKAGMKLGAEAADNSVGTQACMAIASNKPLNVIGTMRDLRLSKRVMTEKLFCNDMPTNKFVSTYGLHNSAKYLNFDIATKTSIQDIANVSDDTVIVIAGSK